MDPTYAKEEIEAKPEWELAFAISEIQNDRAPLGWSNYVSLAKSLLARYRIERKSL